MGSMSAAQAVGALMRAYGKLVFHTIYGLTDDWEESQDLTRDTFLQALRAIDAARASSGGDFHAKAWLLGIAVNTVRMRHKRVHLMRFIPFSRLSEEGQEERETSAESLSKQAAPVQPAGYGTAAAGDPAEVVAERDALGERWHSFLKRSVFVCSFQSSVGSLQAKSPLCSISVRPRCVSD